jgi:GTP-binding protein HflX
VLGKLRVTALNKIDLLDEPDELDTSLYPNAVPVSALRQEGLDALCEKIIEVLANNMDTVQVLIPFSNGDLVELFHRRGHIDQEVHKPEGVYIAGRIPPSLHGYYSSYAHPSG